MSWTLPLLADEDFDNRILRGLRRRRANLDLTRVQDVGLLGRLDGVILEAAAQAGRVLLTHDMETMPEAAYERVMAGLPMPGVFAVSQSLPIRQVIEDLLLLAECSQEREWEGQVRYLPL